MAYRAVETIIFRKDLAAGQSVTLEQRIKGNGTLEYIVPRFYPGQAKNLHIRPVLIRLSGSPVDLVTYLDDGEQYLSGDDDSFRIPVSMPVYNDEKVILMCENTAVEDPGEEGTKTYSIVCDMVIDYYAGNQRVAGSVI